MHRVLTLAAACLATSGLSACGASTPAGAPDVTRPPVLSSPATSATTTSATTSAAAATTQAGPSVLKLGQTHKGPDVSIQVLAYNASVPVTTPITKGQRWAAVKAKSCNTGKQPVSFSWVPWALADADDGQYPFLDMTGPEFPRPTYPDGLTSGTHVNPGRCVAGWIVFQVPKAMKAATVTWATDDESETWKLS